MKNINIILIIASYITFAGCSLEVENENFLTTENFYTTRAEIENGLLHAYSTLNFRDYQRPFLTIPIVASELAGVKANEPRQPQPLQTFEVDGTNQQLVDFFRFSYVGINRANTIIEAIDASDLPTVQTDKLLGEAYFLRGFHHFNLVRLFGEIPIRIKSTSSQSDALGVDLAAIGDVYNQIISDLMFASDLMPISRDAGRADKVAAQGLLAKVYITIASSAASGRPEYNFVTDPTTYYSLASEAASAVVFDQTEYGFEPDLLQIYNVETRADLNGLQHIFFINFDRETAADEVIGSKTGLFFWPAAGVLGAGGTGTCGLQLATSDGRFVTNGFSVYQALPAFFDTYAPTDRRLTELVIDSLFDASGELFWTPSYANSAQVPFSAKYLDLCEGEFTQTRPMILRFTDVLLIYAEAQGPTAAGYEAVNRVRARAGLDALIPGLSVAEFRKAIIQERSWELAFEGHRLYDTRRTNSVEEAFAAVGAEDLLIGTDNLYRFPIPDLEIILNP